MRSYWEAVSAFERRIRSALAKRFGGSARGRDSMPDPTPARRNIPRPSDDEDASAWPLYWTSVGEPWRREPEIELERQGYLTRLYQYSTFEQEYMAAMSKRPIPLTKTLKPYDTRVLDRADVEWLLASRLRTHVEMRSPRRTVEMLDLRGAIIYGDLSGLDLSDALLRGADLAGPRAVGMARPTQNYGPAGEIVDDDIPDYLERFYGGYNPRDDEYYQEVYSEPDGSWVEASSEDKDVDEVEEMGDDEDEYDGDENDHLFDQHGDFRSESAFVHYFESYEPYYRDSDEAYDEVADADDSVDDDDEEYEKDDDEDYEEPGGDDSDDDEVN